MSGGETTRIVRWVERLQSGDESALDELLVHFERQLLRLTRKMLGTFPGVKRWEQTDDVFVQASIRLRRALCEVIPRSTKEFFGLAALQVRRELLNMARKYRNWECPSHGRSLAPMSPNGRAPDCHADPPAEDDLALWDEFHDAAARLDEPIRQVFELLWYGGLEKGDVAAVMGVSVRTVQIRWLKARIEIRQALGDRLPAT